MPGGPVTGRPMENAGYAAQQDAATQVMADCALPVSQHHQAVLAASLGEPSLAVQDRTHGAGLPAAGNGPGPGPAAG